MRTLLLVIVSFAILGFTPSTCEKRSRRQLWPQPPNRDPFWMGHSPEFHRNDNFFNNPPNPWGGMSGFAQSFRNPNTFQNFRDDNQFNDINGQSQNFMNGFLSNGNYQKSRDNNRRNNDGNQNKRKNQNQGDKDGQNNRRNQNQRTTEPTGPLTTTPTTIHYAPQGCSCTLTQQFNPVCGTDGNTYRNEGLLNCYRQCGTEVSQKRLGVC